MTDDELDEMLDARARQYADRLSKEFGSKLANNAQLAARALEIHFGRRLPELMGELRAYLPEDCGEETGEEDDF